MKSTVYLKVPVVIECERPQNRKDAIKEMKKMIEGYACNSFSIPRGGYRAEQKGRITEIKQ